LYGDKGVIPLCIKKWPFSEILKGLNQGAWMK
jgi:hypothetical protein